MMETFNPAYGNGITVAPGVVSAASVIDTKTSKSLCLSNLGTEVCYIKVGDSDVVATVADYPVLVGAQVTITKDQDHTHIAYLTAAGVGSLHVIKGEGF